MEIEDAVHCIYMAKGLKQCPTCFEDLTIDELGDINVEM